MIVVIQLSKYTLSFVIGQKFSHRSRYHFKRDYCKDLDTISNRLLQKYVVTKLQRGSQLITLILYVHFVETPRKFVIAKLSIIVSVSANNATI